MPVVPRRASGDGPRGPRRTSTRHRGPAAAPRGAAASRRSGRRGGSCGRAAGLARVPDRGAGVGLEQDRQGRRRTRRRAAGRADRHDVPAGRQRQPRGPHRGSSASSSAPATRPASGPTRSCCCTPAPGPTCCCRSRATRWCDPRPRHHQDQRRVRLRRPEAAGGDDRAEHRHPDRPLRRDRLRRLRELVDAVGGIRICTTAGMDDPLAKLDIEKGCQHVDGTARSPTRAPVTRRPTATSTAPSTSARWSAGRRQGDVAVDRGSTRCATSGSPTPAPGRCGQQGHRPVRRSAGSRGR